jgi:hypothetical protein
MHYNAPRMANNYNAGKNFLTQAPWTPRGFVLVLPQLSLKWLSMAQAMELLDNCSINSILWAHARLKAQGLG